MEASPSANVRSLLLQPNVAHTKLGTINPWDVPPLGLAYIAAVLEKNNFPVKVIDAYIENLNLYELEERIDEYSPRIIGITSNGYTAQIAIETAIFLKEHFPEILIVMGGPFPTTESNQLLSHNFCDICIIGEGEFTFLELVKKISENKDWTTINGISYRRNNEVITNPRRKYIENLDILPFPAWHLFPDLHKYRNLRGATYHPYAPIITSRGCPFSCNWCLKSIHGYRFRARSPKNVVDEIEYLVENFGIKEIAIMDDAFTLKPKRVKEICLLLLKRRISIFFNFYSGIRADSISDSLIQAIRSVGANRITVGIESGNQTIVNKVGKALNLENVLKVVKIAKKYNIVVDGFFILGHPYDTLETMDQTIDFAIKSGLDHAYFFIAIPFPGTKLYEIVKEKGKILQDITFGSKHHIVEGKPVFIMPQFTEIQLMQKYREAYSRFYYRPKKLISLIVLHLRLIIQYKSIEEIRWLIGQLFHLIRLNPFKKKKKKRK